MYGLIECRAPRNRKTPHICVAGGSKSLTDEVVMSKSRENFVRLAERRTRRALKDIRLIGNLSNRSNYSWSDEDVASIFSALEAEMKTARRRFAEEPRGNLEVSFSLSPEGT